MTTEDTTPAPGCKVLTKEQLDHFEKKGYLILHDCFDKEHADWMMKGIWSRLKVYGVDKNDKSTWTKGRYHLPAHRVVKVDDFSPKAYYAMCDLAGGEGKYEDETFRWYDNPIVNLGTDEDEKTDGSPPKNGWHIDGGSFTHFLDAPEVAMLVVPIYSDEIKHMGGATYIAPDSLPIVAKYLLEHPQGAPQEGEPMDFSAMIAQCKEFVEFTAKVGDVAFVHPFMLHASSANALRIPRFMANPCMSFKEPLRFDLPWDQLNSVERATLNALGVKSLDFKITGQRKQFSNDRYKEWAAARQKEIDALREDGYAMDFLCGYEILKNPNIVTL